MLKNVNIKTLFMGIVFGILLYILPILLLKPDNHIIAYIYDKDILELYKQKRLKLKKKLSKGEKVNVDDIYVDESINGMEII